MEEIITQILQDLGRNLLEADISFIKEAERFDKFEKTVRELCTATAARILSEALTDLDDSIRGLGKSWRTSLMPSGTN